MIPRDYYKVDSTIISKLSYNRTGIKLYSDVYTMICSSLKKANP